MQRRLYRSRRDRVVFGVAGGLGKYFDVDPVLIRVAFVAFAFVSGIGILAYIILAIVAPLEPIGADSPGPTVGEGRAGNPPVQSEGVQDRSGRWQGRSIAGLVLVIVGVFFLLGQFGLWWWRWGWGVLWPLVLIGLGLFIILNRARRS